MLEERVAGVAMGHQQPAMGHHVFYHGALRGVQGSTRRSETTGRGGRGLVGGGGGVWTWAYQGGCVIGPLLESKGAVRDQGGYQGFAGKLSGLPGDY